MWPVKNRSDERFSAAAQTAATVLLAATEEAAPHLWKALVRGDDAAKNEELAAPVAMELLVFGLHFTDRIAFGRLGVEDRATFMDSLLPAIQSGLQPSIAEHLRGLYNTRNTFYGGFRKLFPDGQEGLKGTLFWEFGKALGSVYANSNPVVVTETSMFGMDYIQALTRAFEAQAVFL